MRNLRGKCGYCAAAEASLASFASCSDRLHESSPPVPAVEFLSGPDTNQQAPGLLWPHRSAGVPAEVIVAFGISPAVATPSSTGFECQAYLEAIELTPLAEARSAGGFFIVYSSDRFLRCPKRCRQCSLARPWGDIAEHGKGRVWLPRQVHPTSASLLSWAFLGHELRAPARLSIHLCAVWATPPDVEGC